LSRRAGNLLLTLLSLAVLVPSLYYPYVNERENPDFTLAQDWRVLAAAPCAADGCLKVGDQVITIGKLDLATFNHDRWIELLDGFDRHGMATVTVRRHGRIVSFPVSARNAASSSGPPLVLFPLVFWMMGTAAILFLRPRDERWWVLVAWSYVTAVWLASGLASATHFRGAAVIFHIFIWLFAPLCVHLHLILPNTLLSQRLRRVALGSVYAVVLVLVVLDGLYLLRPPPYAPLLFTLAGMLLSVGLLLLRLFLPLDPAVKVASRIMLFGLFLGLGPFLFFYGMLPLLQHKLEGGIPDLWALYPWLIGDSLLSLPMLPMSYIYAIYKHHLGALEFRANRLFGIYSFSALAISAYLIALGVVSGSTPLDERLLGSVLVVSLVFAFGTPLLREPFQKLIDRHVFGVRHTPEEVINLVAERVPLAFNRGMLARMLVDEVLPTLLIRQSALYLFAAPQHEVLYEQGLPADETPVGPPELRRLLAQGGRYLPPQQAAAPRGWVRLVIPLALQSEPLGVWLIGRRDPDDHFPASDIRLLSTVANQIAPMVQNIRLYERAQQEIAQRIVAEDAIRRSEERFRNLFEATLEGIAIVKGGVILEVNHALLGIFGYQAGELIGRELAELLPETGPALAGEPREGTAWKRDGSLVDIEIAAKQYVFQGEDVTVVAIRDIERRKRDEAENQLLQRQLLNSQKMEAIGRLSAGVAHDFNNCLLAIFGYTDLLLEQHAGPAGAGGFPEQTGPAGLAGLAGHAGQTGHAGQAADLALQSNLTGIRDAAQKAAALTRQLLAFARRQPMEVQVVDLSAVIKGLEKMLRRLLGDDVMLITELDPRLPRVKIDPAKLDQVIVNLAVNARHAMPDGGRLTVRTMLLAVSAVTPAPHADVPAGSHVLLTVTDTGVGMDAETHARAFEPFFTTKDDGTGLGLASAYGIVRQSGGRIFVDSAPGKGACFSIYLPATTEREDARQEPAAAAADTGVEAILLVEDENGVRTVLQRILASRGYRVLAATGADEALEVARRTRSGIDLLLTDITMPRVKGPELAAALLAEQPRMRVLFMSGYSEGALPSGAGAPMCLQKPFSARTLARTVRAVLDAAPPPPAMPAV
jgi:two-component system cell cycle sensor histidine kinase/response regulator CckA